MHSNKVVLDFHLKKMEKVTALTTMIMMIMMFTLCDASCYFGAEYQGVYVTQSTVIDDGVEYSHVNITEDAIPIWGQCHRKQGNNVILMIGSEETVCFRCFHLKLVSKNIMRVLTADDDYISKCYTNEEIALASCLNEDTFMDESKNTEIILYKRIDWKGDVIRQEYCPIHGLYKLTYNVYDGTDDKITCPTHDSELDSCPSGSDLNLRFRKCAFGSKDISFKCLGHWKGLKNQNLVALMNGRSDDSSLGPKYRCATYFENPRTNTIEISLSKDSTCRSINKYNGDGNGINNYRSEKLTLYPIPQEFGTSNQYCSFPNWLIGDWEQVIVNSNQLIYKDHSSFKTYTMKCVKNLTNQDKYLVHTQTQCGEESYQCLKIKKRDTNVFEFQISPERSPNFTISICNEGNFHEDRWLTQGRLNSNNIMSPCPISGQFTGSIPDDDGLCANLSSECQSQDIMYYKISACSTDEVYEEREYKCLGQWLENGLVYTYTHRLDVGVYECFVGTVLSDDQIYIKEAGEHCQRETNIYAYGMELNKVASCNLPELFKTSDRPTHKYYEVSTIKSTTKLQSSSNSALTTQKPQTLVTDRNSIRYSVTNLPKHQTTTRPPPQVIGGTTVSSHSNYLLLVSSICVILVFNKIRN